jgi:two-component system, response regulator PdtaR
MHIRHQVVLVVEDDPLILLDAVSFLERAGITVLSEGTAAKALEVLESRQDIGLVFTDIDMPGRMDGLLLARNIQSRWPHIALILTSGQMSRIPVPAGAMFIPKPYCQQDVLTAAQHLLHAQIGSLNSYSRQNQANG